MEGDTALHDNMLPDARSITPTSVYLFGGAHIHHPQRKATMLQQAIPHYEHKTLRNQSVHEDCEGRGGVRNADRLNDDDKW